MMNFIYFFCILSFVFILIMSGCPLGYSSNEYTNSTNSIEIPSSNEFADNSAPSIYQQPRNYIEKNH